MNTKVMDGNEAAAHIAYKATEISTLYPITPASPMGEFADQWATDGITNIWGSIPHVIEMQSEGGAAAALHGALQTGALATTYTASQGLLLMIPNMYKISGELTSAVIHVATRSIATHALSIFCDHSDVMAVRDTGFAMLASGSVQEAHDLALIAHAATLKARVPFLHFFDGFRISHEINKITMIPDEQIRQMIDEDLVHAHRKRALSPEKPCIRGTSQNPDVYFQSRERVNPFYLKTPEIVENYMQKFNALSGRSYNLMQYHGQNDAERIIVALSSGAKTAINAANELIAKGEKVGVIQIYLYRPFSIKHFIEILPKTTKAIAVLDRTKEAGSLGEPLYQDILTAVCESSHQGNLPITFPKIIGGRFGLSSKDFVPAMAKAIFDELKKDNPKNHFTVGITDDVTNTSLSYDPNLVAVCEKQTCAIFYGLGSDGTVGANKNTLKIIGTQTDLYVQGYFVYDSKKSGSKTVSHLRISEKPISAPYLIEMADFIGCHNFNFINSDIILNNANTGCIFLLNSPFGPNEIWDHLPRIVAEKIIAKKIKFYVIDASKVALAAGMGNRINTIMQTCFLAISNIIPRQDAIAKIKDTITKTYLRKGEEVVKKNFAAVDQALDNLFEVKVPEKVSPKSYELPPIVSIKAPEFVQKVTAEMMADRGDKLPLSSLPIDGTYPTGTAKWEKRNIAAIVPTWNQELCIQCGQCSLICPHSIIKVKHISQENLTNAPLNFKTAKCRAKELPQDHQFRLQVYIEDCTGCGLCGEICPAINKESKQKAITFTPKEKILKQELENIEFFEKLPPNNRSELEPTNSRNIQYLQSYFEYSGACSGCGETPYIKLISQLFGNRMLVANATGCSSIYGGNLPTTPWTFDEKGFGPSWSNSLFEDNAEFGYGFYLSENKQREFALELLKNLSQQVGTTLADEIIQGINNNDEKNIAAQRKRIDELKKKLLQIKDKSPNADHLLVLANHLIKKSIWLIGGDGWAYDIGYGGLDHVIASKNNVNILVLDTGVYSNTGGQASKATPRAAVAQFASGGKPNSRKDLGMMAINYAGVYVAQIALAANPIHAIRSIIKAEQYEGPSLIIAYSNCIAHGYDLKNSITQQKLAVNSGFWPLYSYDPQETEKNSNPFQLESKDPTIPVRDYAYNEARFKFLLQHNPKHAEELMIQLQQDIDRKWKFYKYLAARTM